LWEHSLNSQEFHLKGDVVLEEVREGAVVDGAADGEDSIRVGLEPPCAGAFESDMVDELVAGLEAKTVPRVTTLTSASGRPAIGG
jgi:hypothetical protein